MEYLIDGELDPFFDTFIIDFAFKSNFLELGSHSILNCAHFLGNHIEAILWIRVDFANVHIEKLQGIMNLNDLFGVQVLKLHSPLHILVRVAGDQIS